MTRPQHQLHHAPRGFTLIELVLAMGMVAILAVSLYASLKVAFDDQATATAAVEPSRTADIAMQFIRQDLQNALPPHDPSMFEVPPYLYLAGAFQGQSSGGASGSDADLIFFSTSDAKQHAYGNGEIKRIELTTTSDANQKTCLVRRCTANLTVQTSPPPFDEEVLCRGIDSFGLRYFDGTNWNDYWDSTQMTPNELPVAVEVTLTLDRTPKGQSAKQLIRFVRIFQIAASTAAEDADVSTGIP